MKLHEYQAKQLLGGFGVEVPGGGVAEDAEEAVRVAEGLGGDGWVVKAQVHAGGRGKAGGVRLCSGIEDVRAAADDILGMRLVSPQTGAEGVVVRKVLVTERSAIEKELYAGVILDRHAGCPVMMVSGEGGVEIEEVARTHPDKIYREHFDPRAGLREYQGRLLARRLGFGGAQLRHLSTLLVRLARAFLESDASLAEINPLVVTSEGRVVALDAKLSVDDNALWRHGDLAALRDREAEDPLELRAEESGLSYIRLDGNIGCMVNGAGLAMATLDILQYYGGEPANFLDVGGGATTDNVTEAFRIILEDSRVRAILVNIFGGIMKCDVIAEGVLAAVRSVDLRVPLVVRLEGTNVERGREILKTSGLAVISARGLGEAAKIAVDAAGGGDTR